MTSHTPQPPAGDDLVARQVRRALLKNLPPMSSDAEYNATFNALLTGICEALTQHTEPVAGEVEVVAATLRDISTRAPSCLSWPEVAAMKKAVSFLSSYDALAAGKDAEVRSLLMAIENAARMAEQGILSADGGMAASEIRSLMPKEFRALKDEGGAP